jgi:hypothetical protein
MNIRNVLLIVFLAGGPLLYAQTPHEPTSATDAEVKLHNGKRLKKTGARARGTERQGESVQKQKRARSKQPVAKESRVFKRHNHFATKEKTRSRSRGTKKTTAAKN